MPLYHIRLINSEFVSSADADHESIDEALRGGIDSAIDVARDALTKGEASVAVEIRLEEQGIVVARRVLALGVSELAVD